MVLKLGVIAALSATVAVVATPVPAAAQDMFAGFVLARVCLPYASRAQTFEGAIRAARDMEFRRPSGDGAPLDEWASEVELVSKDGAWRLRIEEGTVTQGETDVYQVTCRISSTRASARELSNAARLALSGNERWTSAEENDRWEKRTGSPEEHTLHVDVTEPPGERPVLAATGSYY